MEKNTSANSRYDASLPSSGTSHTAAVLSQKEKKHQDITTKLAFT